MNVIRTVSQLRTSLSALRSEGLTVGFVPTMGFLHEGHAQVIRHSTKENQVTVVSIFVNPLQFNNVDDLEQYPRDEEQDLGLLSSLQVDIVFIPAISEVYPTPTSVTLSVSSLEDRLEGFYRPGHFQGVGIVVTKLLNFVQPDKAYFGLKDLQQFAIIKQIVSDLSIPVKVVGVPTVRSQSGLALSSRNSRLSKQGLAEGADIYKLLVLAKKHLEEHLDPALTTAFIRDFADKQTSLEIEYFSVIDPDTFEEIETFSPGGSVAICIAAYLEGVRLIDNLYLRPDSAE
jgi:pantoate--beta-alanine ligase